MTKLNKPVGKKSSDEKPRRAAIEAFITKNLHSFARRDTAPPPIIEKIGGKTRTVKWRLFVNHFFFIERGQIESEPDYMSLVGKHDGVEIEMAIANINLSEQWRILSCDTKCWGENWCEDVAPTEEAVISSMLEFLFKGGYIIADVEYPVELEI